jgi:hypothetical protein
MVTWEAVTAVSTAVTAVVIAATAVVGYRQLKHLRQATQLEGTLKIFDELGSEELRNARRFVWTDLHDKMQDPKFRAEIAAVGLTDEHVHRELQVLRAFEKIGTYVRYRFIDPEMICDYAGPWVRGTWEVLDDLGIIAEHRRNFGGPMLWENFERLYRSVCEFDARRAEPVVIPGKKRWAHYRDIVRGDATPHE